MAFSSRSDGAAAPVFHHADIALMPEGDAPEAEFYRPLRPTVMVWGIDGFEGWSDPARLSERFEGYDRIGLRLKAANLWMLTGLSRFLHEDPELAEATCRTIEGRRIIPPWLSDNIHEGTPSYWGCTNHPYFQANLMKRIRISMSAGANMLHFDDHLGTLAAVLYQGACFCSYCRDGFRRWLENRFSRPQLTDLGVPEIAQFDYRAMILGSGVTSDQDYLTALEAGTIPLREEFLAYQREAAVGVLMKFRDLAASIHGAPVPVGVNAYNLMPTHFATLGVTDYYANEIEHYGVEATIPPLAYLLGSALGRPVFATGSGHCWINVAEHGDVVRVRRWIAMAYAFGHYFMYAYNKWGYSPETGTQWYRTPLSTYRGMFDFVSNHPRLFDGYEAVAQVGVLYDNEACRAGNWQVREVCRALHDAGVSPGLVVKGDAWLEPQEPLEERAFELTVVPGDVAPPELPGSPLVVWTGSDDVRRQIKPWIRVNPADGIWALPRKRPDDPRAPVLIHLLNQSYDADLDAMLIQETVDLTVSHDLTGGRPPLSATVYAPERSPQPLSLKMRHGDGQTTFSVPTVEIWAVVALEVP